MPSPSTDFSGVPVSICPETANLGAFPSKYTSVSATHPWKQPKPSRESVFGNRIDVSATQFENAASPTTLIHDSNITRFRAQQSTKALAPISRTVAGIRTLVIRLHAINAASLIFRTGRPSI